MTVFASDAVLLIFFFVCIKYHNNDCIALETVQMNVFISITVLTDTSVYDKLLVVVFISLPSLLKVLLTQNALSKSHSV